MVMICGLDSAKEETEAYERPFLDRGIAILVFDGPGQGEGEYDSPIRGDYEVPARAVVDYVDAAGRSRRRAHRALGREPRRLLRTAGSSLRRAHQGLHRAGGPFDWGEAWDGLPELTREAFRVRSHCATPEEAQRHAATLSLVDVAQRITCPMFIVTGKLDRVIPWQHAERLARARQRPRGSAADRGRQPRRQQPRLPLAPAIRRLDGGAARRGIALAGGRRGRRPSGG